MSLPWRRISSSRPATRTETSVSSPGSSAAELLAQLGDRAVPVEAHRVGIDARGPQLLDLGEPPLELLVVARRRHALVTRFLSKTIRRPRSVSQGSWCWIVRENGRISSARPPVAITVHSPSSSSNRSTIAST